MGTLLLTVTLCIILQLDLISAQTDDQYTFTTLPSQPYDKTWVRAAGESLRFEVTSCSDAFVGLAGAPNANRPNYEFRIGTYGNTRCELLKNDNVVVMVDSPSIISCSSPTKFWISFSGGTFALGQGHEAGKNLVLQWEDLSPGPVGALAFRSSSGQTARWAVARSDVDLQEARVSLVNEEGGGSLIPSYVAPDGDEDNLIYVRTRQVYQYDTVWVTTEQSQFIFDVKSCKDAHIMLTEGAWFDSGPYYQVVLGAAGNSRTDIRGPSRSVQRPSPSVMNCNEFRTFWITWNNDEIRVGSGSVVNTSLIANLADPRLRSYQISALSLSSWTSSTGEWKFYRDTGYTISSQTQGGNLNYNTMWMTVQETKFMTFRVRACQDARVVITSQVAINPTDTMYEFILAQNNNKSIIRAVPGDDTISAATPDLLSCVDFRSFWVSWNQGVVRLGQGETNGVGVIIEGRLPQINATHLGIATVGNNNKGLWEFRHIQDEQWLVRAENNRPFRSTWMNIRSKTVFEFYLRSCGEAVIELAQRPNDTNEVYLSVLIGTSNGDTVLTGKIQGGPDFTESRATPGLLSCDVRRKFWLSWGNGNVQLGRGHLFTNVIIEKSGVNNWRRYKYISYGTQSQTQPSDYDFDRRAGNLISVRTTKMRLFDQAWLTAYDMDSLRFSVKTCQDARLALTQFLGNTRVRTYEVVIAEQNTNNRLRNGLGGDILATSPANNVLSCDQFREFWLSWKNGLLQLGTGPEIGSSTILSYNLTTIWPISSVGFACGMTSDADWIVGEAEGEVITTLTDKGLNYFTNFIATYRTLMEFQVQSCGDAYILLPKWLGVADREAYEIHMGVNGGSTTEIRRIGTSAPSDTRTFNTPGLLECNTPRRLWLSWANGQIQLGIGDTGSQPLFTYTDPSPIRPIVGVTVSAAQGKSAFWVLDQNLGSNIRLETSALFNSYTENAATLHDDKPLFFSVMSCNDVHVALGSYLGAPESNTYEIVIGGWSNSKSAIRKTAGGPNRVQPNTPGILNCSEYRDFWIQWTHGFIQVGTGRDISKGRFMSWLDPNYHQVRAVAVSTGWGGTGKWSFNKINDDTLTVNTQAGMAFDNGWVTSKDPIVRFKVRACREAQLALYDGTPDITAQHSFEVIIGANQNTGIELRSGPTRQLVQNITYPDALSCSELRPFYIKWGELNSIQVGAGDNPVALLMHTLPDAPRINSVAFKSGTTLDNTVTGEWQFLKRSGQTYTVIARASQPMARDYTQAWLTVGIHSSNMVFSIEKCYQAYIALSEIPGITINATHQVVIGSNGNRRVEIQNAAGQVVASQDLQSDVLQCNLENHLWISWTDRQSIAMGLGSVPGEAQLIVYRNLDHRIMTMAVASSGATMWHFRETKGNLFSIKTPNSFGYDKAWLSPRADVSSLLFSVSASEEARIYMETDPGVTGTTPGYEITMGAMSNQQTTIKNSTGTLVQLALSPDLLDPTNLQPFWLRWFRSIALGQGMPFGAEFINYQPFAIGVQLPGALPFHSLSISTTPQSQGFWQFSTDKIAVSRFMTPNERVYGNYWIGVQGRDWLLFNVKACHSALLALTAIPYDSTTRTYEIEICRRQDQQSVIRDSVLGTTVALAQTPLTLSCDESMTFWVGWKNGSVTVGNSGVFGKNQFMSWQAPQPHPVSTVGIATHAGAVGEWDIVQLGGNTYTAFTPTRLEFRRVWVHMRQNYITFRLKTCHDGHVALSENAFVTRNSTYEIVIGGWKNQRSAIKNRTQAGRGTHYTTVQTPNIVSCNEYRSFWITWQDSTITFGSGELGSLALVSWRDPRFHPVNAVSFSTAYGQTGRWEIKQSEDDWVQMWTPTRYGYDTNWVSVVGRKDMVFQVQACNNVQVVLTTTQGKPDAMTTEVVIGGWENTKSVIRDGPQGNEVTAQVETRGILSCTEPRTFWLRWARRVVQVGRGSEIGSNQFLSYSERNHSVYALGLSTGEGSDGSWHFDSPSLIPTQAPPTTTPQPTQTPSLDTSTNFYRLYTPSDKGYQYMWTATDSRYFVFRIMACHDATIGLSEVPGVTSNNLYEIIIGGYKNTRTFIRKVKDGNRDIRQNADTVGVLNCTEYRDFWVTWRSSIISVGFGVTIGSNVLVTWQDSVPFQVSGVAMTTGWGANGTWQFNQDQFRTAFVSTSTAFQYRYVWLHEREHTHAIFGVRACNDALLSLRQDEMLASPVYEIVIGGYGNRRSDIRSREQGTVEAFTSTPGILSCNETRYFWISWDSGKVEVGRGRTLFQDRFLMWQDPSPHNVTAIGISNGWGSNGTWRINHAEKNALLLKTKNTYSYRQTWLNIKDRTVFSFRVRACSDAVVELRPLPMTYDLLKVQITLGTNNNMNTKIKIVQARQPDIEQSFSTPNLLHCDVYRRLWVRWGDGYVTVGRKNPGTNQLILMPDPYNNVKARALSMGSLQPNYFSEWEFDRDAGRTTRILTDPADRYEGSWLVVADERQFVFKVQAASDANILLARYIHNPRNNYAEIKMGLNGNMQTSILVEGRNVNTTQTPNLLNAQLSQYFWISWGYGRLALGKGLTPGLSTLIETQTPLPFEVEALAFATESSSRGLWEIGEIEDHSYNIITPASFNNYSDIWFTTQKSLITFSVKACFNARVVLSPQFGNTTGGGYEFTIGTATGKTILKRLPDQTARAQANTPGILDCNDMRDFYIRLEGNRIRFDSGTPDVSSQAIIDWTETSTPYVVTAMSISTDQQSSGEWVIRKDIGRVARATTPNQYTYNRIRQTVVKQDHIMFKVKARNDAHIALSTVMGVTESQTYEVVLGGGGNQRSFLRDAPLSGYQRVVQTPGILSGNEMRPFWISWKDGLIQVGRGHRLGEQTIMTFKSRYPRAVHAVAISTGWGADGVWEFSEIEDDVYILQTETTDDYGRFQMPTRSDFFEFQVESCRSAKIGLFAQSTSMPKYEVTLGAQNNQRLVIRDTEQGQPVQDLLMPDLLSCDKMRRFWVDWRGTAVSVGQGSWPNLRLAQYVIPGGGVPVVNGIAPRSGEGADSSSAEWEFTTDMGESVNFLSTTNTYQKFWFTSTDKTTLTFSVNTCNAVGLALSDIPEVTTTDTYEVEIGTEGYRRVVIRSSVGGREERFTDLNGVLVCNDWNYYWTSWEGGRIEVGLGTTPGASRFLDWTDPSPHGVNAVWIKSTGPANWRFGQHHGDTYQIHTQSQFDYSKAWFVPNTARQYFTFKIKACWDAYLALSPQAGRFDSAVEVKLGTSNNQNVSISFRGQVQNETMMPGLLDCKRFRRFWVAWNNDAVRIGRGLPFEEPILSWTNNGPNNVNSIALSTNIGSNGHWEFEQDQVTALSYSSPNDVLYDGYWTMLRDRNSFIFKVTACNNAIVTLSQIPFVRAGKMYEIDIGDAGNTKTVLRNGTTKAVLAESSTPNILSCTADQAFWVQWTNNSIVVGSGGEVGHNTILTWTIFTESVSVTSLVANTYQGATGNWSIAFSDGNVFIPLTNNDYTYERGYLVVNGTSVTFKVQACNDVHLLLQQTPGNETNAYEVVIGGWRNSQSVIRNRKQGNNVVTARTPGILSCDSMRSFWISWVNQTVMVGTGKLNSHAFMAYRDPNFNPINAVAVSTGFGSGDAVWNFDQGNGDPWMIRTPGVHAYDTHWMSAVGHNSFVFSLKACKDGHLALTSVPGNLRDEAYEIVIGGWNNQRSVIRNSFGYGNEVLQVDTPDIMQCDQYLDFWVSWTAPNIAVGRGLVPGMYTFMNWTDPNHHTVNAIGMATAQGAVGLWNIRSRRFFTPPPPGIPTTAFPPPPTVPAPDLTSNDMYTVATNTKSDNDFGYATLITDGDFIVFTVTSCKAAHIALQQDPRTSASDSYIIAIGENNNQATSISRTAPNPISRQVPSPAVLSCSTPRTFWIQWIAGRIEVGQGAVVGVQSIVALTDIEFFSVHAVSMTTKEDAVGRFQFLRHYGRLLQVTTSERNANPDYTQALVQVTGYEKIVFGLKACSHARLMLNDVRDDMNDAWEVIIGDNDNKQTRIERRTLGTGEVWASTDTNEILDCNKIRFFWLQWTRDQLILGTGREVGDDVVLRTPPTPRPRDTNFISVSTSSNKAGAWEFRNFEGDVFTMFTSSTDDYTKNSIQVRRHYLEFEVKACGEARIALSSLAFRTNRDTYEVVIGNQGNTITSIRESVDGADAVTAQTPQILSCHEPRRFWISFGEPGNVLIEVGRESVHTNRILAFRPSRNHGVRAVSLRTSAAVGGAEWILEDTEVRSLTSNTSRTDSYRQLWFSHHFHEMAFKVKACQDAKIALSQYPGVTRYTSYEIVIGSDNNQKTRIRRDVDINTWNTVIDTRNILNCDRSQWFWLSWNDGHIQLGNGPVPGTEIIAEYEDQNARSVDSLSFSTSSQSEGTWEFTEVEDKRFTVTSSGTGRFEETMTTIPSGYHRFRVMACSDVRLALGTQISNWTNYNYEVTIGVDGNTHSHINRMNDQGQKVEVVEEETNGILDCRESRPFWVSWDGSVIQVGRGDSPGENVFMEYTDQQPKPAYLVAMTTGNNQRGEWKYGLATGQVARIRTPEYYTYTNAHYQIVKEDFIFFTVRACNDAHIGLFESLSTATVFPYEIVLGGYKNNKSDIRDGAQGRIVAQANTKNILSCNSQRPFWISWRQGTILVGRGWVVYNNVFLTYNAPNLRGVHMVALSTGWGSEGLWSFRKYDGDEYLLQTSDDSSYHTMWLSPALDENTFEFKVTGCSNAHITLYPGFNLEPTYDIVLGARNNEVSRIYKGNRNNNPPVLEESTDDILHCFEEQKFSLTWKEGDIVLKRDSARGRQIMGWKDPEVAAGQSAAVSGLSVSTGPGSTGQWEFKRSSAKFIRFFTPNEYQYNKVIYTPADEGYFLFSVQACNDAHISLSSFVGLVNIATYEVVIGGYSNRQSDIRDGVQGRHLHNAQTPGILDCNELRPFWVSWWGGVIEVGRGSITGQNRFLYYRDPRPKGTNAISISTGWGATGIWEFGQVTGNMYHVHTPVKYNYTYNWFVPTRENVVFDASACHDAHLALAQEPMNTSVNTYSVVIGGGGNSRQWIRENILGPNLKEERIYGLIDCKELRRFWIRWDSGNIRFGVGQLGRRQVLQHNASNPHPVNGVSFSTGWGATGEWEILQDWVKAMYVTTTNQYEYKRLWYTVYGQTSQVVKIKACNDAHISLASIPGNADVSAYEIVIGGWRNQRSVIRKQKQGGHLSIAETPNVLSCNEYRSFWTRWHNATIELGRGAVVGMDSILSWYDNEPYAVKGFGVSTGFSSSGEWMMFANEGDAFTLYTDRQYRYNYTWMVPQTKTFIFKVKTCNDAHILLSSARGSIGQQSYEIVLGGARNTWSQIREGKQGPARAHTPTPRIVRCGRLLPFWIDWSVNDEIRVGTGMEVGTHQLMAWKDPNFKWISSLSLSTWVSAPAEWEIPATQTYQVEVFTTGSNKYQHMDVQVLDQKSVLFEVAACNYAALALSVIPGRPTTLSYEVVIGDAGNTRSVIRRGIQGIELASQSTPNILSCNVPQPFWISWAAGQISLGTGKSVGNNTLMSAQDSTPYDVNAVSVKTKDNQPGQWIFRSPRSAGGTEPPTPSSGGDMYGYFTPNAYRYDMFMTVSQEVFLFGVQACNDAHITLSNIPLNTDTDTYEIVIGGSSNTRTFLRREKLAVPVASEETSGVLSCTEMRKFWLRWTAGKIQVGRGDEVGINKLLEYQDTQPYTVHALSLSTGFGATGRWEFQKDQGRFVNVKTPAALTYNRLWFSRPSLTSLVFRVKAKEHAHILLTPTMYQNQSAHYEIVFGASGNRETIIRTGLGGEQKALAETQNILSDSELRYFWVSWRNGLIEAGIGPQVGNRRVVHWQDPETKDVNAIGISSDDDAPGEWEFYHYDGDIYMVKTDPGDERRVSVSFDRRSFKFKVKACSYAIVELLERPDTPDNRQYQFEIGSNENTMTKVYRYDNATTKRLLKEVQTPYILSCNYFVDFWVTLNSHNLRLGQSTNISDNVILEYQEADSLFTDGITFGVSQLSRSIAGEFQFDTLQGKTARFYTMDRYNYELAWRSVRSQTSIVMRIKAGADAHIVLARYKGVYRTEAYEVVLGGWGNTRSAIRREYNGSNVASEPTPNILSATTFNYFWISWDNGIIEVGRGGFPGSRIIMYYRDDNPRPINAISIATEGQIGVWEFTQPLGKSYTATTPASSGEIQTWMTSSVPWFAFKVQTCEDAHIILPEFPGNTSGRAYEVVIGANGNSEVIIKRNINSPDQHDENTPPLLSCNVLRPFWISWDNSNIRLGRGKPFDDELISWQDGSPRAVTSVGVYTGPNSQGGVWEFNQDYAPSMRVVTQDKYPNYKTLWRTADEDIQFVFKVRACHDAYIALSEQYAVTDHNTYEIAIGIRNNMRTAIRSEKQNDDNPEIEVDTPQILNCNEMRPFWVSWFSGNVQLGRGVKPGVGMIVQWQDDADSPRAVNWIGVGSDHGVATFEVYSLQTDTYVMITPSYYDYTMFNMIPVHYWFKFKVRACRSAYIGLAATGGLGTAAYEIILGDQDNERSVIRDRRPQNPVEVASAVTTGILSCTEYRQFWISWDENTIHVGKGSRVGPAYFMDWRVSDYSAITGVSLSTTREVIGQWQVRKNQVKSTHYKAPTEYTYNSFWISVTGHDYFSFTLRAGSDAHIALSEHPGVFNSYTYEIVIGGWHNTQSVIKESVMGNHVHTAETPRILSPAEPRTFWVGWKNGLIEVGRGAIYGSNRFLWWRDPNPQAVNSIAVSNGFNSDGEWFFNEMLGEGNTYFLHTPEVYEYRFLWAFPNRNYFTFSIQACNDGHIALSQVPGQERNSPTYEVVIGGYGNTQSVIRGSVNGENLKTAQTNNILHCQEMRSFWISWTDQVINVGQGQLYANMFLSYNLPNPHPVHGVGLASEAPADWKFSRKDTHGTTVWTPNEHTYERFFVSVLGRYSLSFKVRACNDAHIALSAYARNTQNMTYEIVIGGFNNLRSVIKKAVGGQILHSADTSFFLSCTVMKTFWISWKDGRIKTGRGGIIDSETFMDWIDPNPHAVTTVGFSTGYGATGEWEIIRPNGETVGMQTNLTYNYNQLQVAPSGSSITFRVRASNDAHVGLFNDRFNPTEAYEIVIGGWSNQLSVIRRTQQADPEARRETPNILDPEDYREFWVQWNNGLIEFGSGSIVGRDRLLHWQDPNPRTIAMVSVSSGFGSEALWEFPQHAGQGVRINTPVVNKYEFAWFSTTDENNIVFSVRACSDVHLVLSHIPGNAQTLTYEVVIGGWSNSQSAMRGSVQGPNLIAIPTPQILSCTESRPFWISWQRGLVQVGRGMVVGSDLFMQFDYTDPHEINSVGISSGFGHTGEWDFQNPKVPISVPASSSTTVTTGRVTTSSTTSRSGQPGSTTRPGIIPGSSTTSSTSGGRPGSTTRPVIRPRTTPSPPARRPPPAQALTAGGRVGVAFLVIAIIMIIVIVVLVLLRRRRGYHGPATEATPSQTYDNPVYSSGFNLAEMQPKGGSYGTSGSDA